LLAAQPMTKGWVLRKRKEAPTEEIISDLNRTYKKNDFSNKKT